MREETMLALLWVLQAFWEVVQVHFFQHMAIYNTDKIMDAEACMI
jgi:hypothetical protein